LFVYESKRMGKYWTRYAPLLSRVRTAWPERDDGIDPGDVIEALAVLHGLGLTIHEIGFHHQHVITLYRMTFQDEIKDRDAPGVRTRLRELVDELDADEPPPSITFIYEEMVRIEMAYMHELALHLKGLASALNDSTLQATG
jgi:hypothetical protein